MIMKIVSEKSLVRIQEALEKLHELAFVFDDIEDFATATTAISIIENELNCKRGGNPK